MSLVTPLTIPSVPSDEIKSLFLFTTMLVGQCTGNALWEQLLKKITIVPHRFVRCNIERLNSPDRIILQFL